MLASLLTPVAIAAGSLAIAVLLLIAGGTVRYIPNDRLGIREKLWSLRGSISGGFIALRGEAGFQPEVLRGGYHFFVPFQYRVHKVPLVTITQGQIGYVFAATASPCRPSRPSPPTRSPTTSGTCAPFSPTVGRRDRSARSSARAPMPSTSRNSSC